MTTNETAEKAVEQEITITVTSDELAAIVWRIYLEYVIVGIPAEDFGLCDQVLARIAQMMMQGGKQS